MTDDRYGLVRMRHLEGQSAPIAETPTIHPRSAFFYPFFAYTTNVTVAFLTVACRAFSRLMTAKVAGRPYWVGDPPMKVVCAWHEDFDPRDPANADATHGICRACITKFEGAA